MLSIVATLVMIVLYEQILICLLAAGYHVYMKLPRRRFKGETTEVDVLRFDKDLEQ